MKQIREEKTMHSTKGLSDERATSRRRFLKQMTALAGPMILPASVLGRAGAVAPNSRITMGCIGLGGQGTGNMNAFLGDPRIQVVAVCDVDKAHRERAREITKLPEDAAYNDFREVVARDDVDTVSIGAPDHWHAIMVVESAKAGKDIYCEKPISLTIAEGQVMCETIRRTRRVLQTGTWRRSRSACRLACELVQSGRIGELKTVKAGVPEGFAIRGGDYAGIQPPMPVPDGFDYDLWLGPAPWEPYTPGRCHFNFRWLMDYSAGYITDWGAHYYDVGQWGNGTDRTGPVAIEGTAEFPADGLYDAPTKHHIEFTFANGVKMLAITSPEARDWGVRFEGTEGWIYVESGSVEGEPKSAVQSPIGPNDVHLYNSPDHHRNFIDCVISREETAAPIDIAHRSASICHLGSIAVQLGRPLRWNPDNERFLDDPEADRMCARAMRGTWTV